MRRVLFWLHLAVGAVFGIGIGFLALTGMMLAPERQVMQAAESGISAAPPYAGAAYLPVEELERRAAALCAAPPGQIVYFSRPNAPVMFQIDRFHVLYMNPYTGASLGSGALRWRAFFSSVEGLHRWFGTWGMAREPARHLQGAFALGLSFLLLSGCALWWPRVLDWRHFRNVALFRSRTSGRARHWNWHNVVGIWCAPLLLISALTGIVLRYQTASNLVYRSMGDTPPGPDHVFNPAGAARLLAARPRWQPAVDRALRWEPEWTMATMNFPDAKGAPIVFVLDSGNGGKPQDQGHLELDQASGSVLRWLPFSRLTHGEQLRELARWSHTGEAGGGIGQAAVCIGATGGLLLSYTGLLLALDRLRSYRSRRRRRSEQQRPAEMAVN